MCCALCGISERDLLVAGHIAPWASNIENRLNPANGICFCVFHDRAFERGYVLLDDQLRALVNPKVDPTSPLGHALASVSGRHLAVPASHPPDRRLLAAHRALFLAK